MLDHSTRYFNAAKLFFLIRSLSSRFIKTREMLSILSNARIRREQRLLVSFVGDELDKVSRRELIRVSLSQTPSLRVSAVRNRRSASLINATLIHDSPSHRFNRRVSLPQPASPPSFPLLPVYYALIIIGLSLNSAFRDERETHLL